MSVGWLNLVRHSVKDAMEQAEHGSYSRVFWMNRGVPSRFPSRIAV